MSNCPAIENMPTGEKKALHKTYHDNNFGYPIHDDIELFGRLILEINQGYYHNYFQVIKLLI